MLKGKTREDIGKHTGPAHLISHHGSIPKFLLFFTAFCAIKFPQTSRSMGKSETPALCLFLSFLFPLLRSGRGSEWGCTIFTKLIEKLSKLAFPDTACNPRPWKSWEKVSLAPFDGQLSCGPGVVYLYLIQWLEVSKMDRGPSCRLGSLKAQAFN